MPMKPARNHEFEPLPKPDPLASRDLSPFADPAILTRGKRRSWMPHTVEDYIEDPYLIDRVKQTHALQRICRELARVVRAERRSKA